MRVITFWHMKTFCSNTLLIWNPYVWICVPLFPAYIVLIISVVSGSTLSRTPSLQRTRNRLCPLSATVACRAEGRLVWQHRNEGTASCSGYCQHNQLLWDGCFALKDASSVNFEWDSQHVLTLSLFVSHVEIRSAFNITTRYRCPLVVTSVN